MGNADQHSLAPPSGSVRLRDARHTAEFGARLAGPLVHAARHRRDGALVALDGPLGAGKSALARGILRAAGVAGPLPSPTFSLVAPYQVAGLALCHLDLYRLGGSDELALLGVDELRERGTLILVEWAGNAPALAADADLEIALQYDGAGRRAALTWNPPRAD